LFTSVVGEKKNMERESAIPAVRAAEVQEMFSSIASRYDLGNSALSFGVHHLWRWILMRCLPRSESLSTLDLCTGTGDLVPLLKRRFGRAVGTDFCFPMLVHGKQKLQKKGEVRPPLVQGDALNLPYGDEAFDIVSVAFGVRNLENLKEGLSEIRRVIRKDGHVMILEFGQPDGLFGFLYRVYSKYWMPLLGGLITGNRDAYTYLLRTSAVFPCGESFENVLRDTGFTPEVTRPLTGGIAFAYVAKRNDGAS